MVHYKLIYFNARGRGERIRLLFALAGVEYEDVRIEWESPEWKKLKSTIPFGQLPILEEDGKILTQSKTIARYLSKKLGFSGKNPWEEAQVDSIIDFLLDFFDETKAFWQMAFHGSPEELINLKDAVLRPSCHKNLTSLSRVLNKSGHGFIIGDSVTFCDIAVAFFCEGLEEYAPEILKDFQELSEHMNRIRSIPNIKAWIEKRPKTSW